MTELRAVVDGLRTPDVERDGLVPAIRSLADLLSRVHHIEIDVVADGEPGLEGRAEHEVFRIVQEALTNAVRHSRAAKVTVEVANADGLDVTIQDDGQGFEPGARNVRGKRLGLTSMRDRASVLGGSLTIDSAPGRGSTVRLEVPA
jgi:signal transduction histidine kinase